MEGSPQRSNHPAPHVACSALAKGERKGHSGKAPLPPQGCSQPTAAERGGGDSRLSPSEGCKALAVSPVLFFQP